MLALSVIPLQRLPLFAPGPAPQVYDPGAGPVAAQCIKLKSAHLLEEDEPQPRTEDTGRRSRQQSASAPKLNCGGSAQSRQPRSKHETEAPSEKVPNRQNGAIRMHRINRPARVRHPPVAKHIMLAQRAAAQSSVPLELTQGQYCTN
jgi:hypothetical protein